MAKHDDAHILGMRVTITTNEPAQDPFALMKRVYPEAVELADGWHILRLLETKPATVAPLTRVRDTLVTMLRQQRAQENGAAFVTRLMTEKRAAVDEITLAKAQKELQ